MFKCISQPLGYTVINFFFKICQKHATTTAFLWVCIFTFEFIIKKLSPADSLLGHPAIPILSVASFSYIYTNHSGLPSFLRRHCKNIRDFWLFAVSAQFFNFAFSTACFLISFQFLGGNGDAQSLFNFVSVDFFWITLLALTLTIHLQVDPLGAARQLKNLASFFLQTVLLSIPVFCATILLLYSRPLGYALFEAILITLFFLSNSYILQSLSRKLRFKCIGSGLLGIVLLLFVSKFFDDKKQAAPFSFQKLIGIRSDWSYTDFEKIKTASQWIYYMNFTKIASAEHLDLAFNKLMILCPLIPTDQSIVVTCFEKNAVASSTSVIVSKNETEILNQLSSPNSYIRLLGLIGARSVSKFSAELTARLEDIRRTDSRYSMIADKTLNNIRNEKQSAVIVRVLPDKR